MVDFDFGSKLKELRLQSGLTQKQLAEQIGITKSVISFYELRERVPSPDILVKLASVFHVSTDYLLGIEKRKTIDISGLDMEDEKVIRLMIEQLRKKNKNRVGIRKKLALYRAAAKNQKKARDKNRQQVR